MRLTSVSSEESGLLPADVGGLAHQLQASTEQYDRPPRARGILQQAAFGRHLLATLQILDLSATIIT